MEKLETIPNKEAVIKQKFADLEDAFASQIEVMYKVRARYKLGNKQTEILENASLMAEAIKKTSDSYEDFIAKIKENNPDYLSNSLDA